MEFLTLTQEEYQTYFKESTYHNFWQSIEMAKMRERKGWDIQYVGVKRNDKLCCACCLQSIVIFRGYKLYMALRGFLMDFHDEELLHFFLQHLTKYLNANNCLYMKLDPYVSYQEHDIDGNCIENTCKEDDILHILQSYGFQHQGFRTHYDDDFEPRWMSVLNLQKKSEDELLKPMLSMTRRNIQASIKNGILVRELTREELPILEKLIDVTGERKNFHKPDLAYFESFYDCFGQHMKAMAAFLNTEDYQSRIALELSQEIQNKEKLELAIQKNPEAKKTIQRLKTLEENIERLQKRAEEAKELASTYGKEVPLAASLFVVYPQEMLYLFGGSYSELQKFKGSYAIQWHMICEALRQEIPRYNFYGISGNFDENAEDYGVYLFKKGFHADVIELLGDFIYIGNSNVYKQYQLLRKVKHKFLQR